MSKRNRVELKFVVTSGERRGAVWLLWMTVRENPPHDIYFAEADHNSADAVEMGYTMHLSIHKDGNAHVRYRSESARKQKPHQYEVTDSKDCTICSVYTPYEDLRALKLPSRHSDALKVEVLLDQKYSQIMLCLFTDPKNNESILSDGSGHSLIHSQQISGKTKLYLYLRYVGHWPIKDIQPVLDKGPFDINRRMPYWTYMKEDGKADIPTVYDFSAQRLNDGPFTNF